MKNSLLKLIFEMIGTIFLTLTFNSTQNILDRNVNFTGSRVIDENFSRNQTAMLLALWVLIIFGWKISGSHYNPAISLAFMLRKDVGNFPRPLGIAYIIIQFLGGFLGALLSWFLDTSPSAAGLVTVNPKLNEYVFYAMLTESIGSFLVVFFYLT